MCTSQFVTQTRNSWNPFMNVKNLQHPAVLLHQGEAGLAMTAPLPTPASPQTNYSTPDAGIVAAHQAPGSGRGDPAPSFRGTTLLG